MKSKTTAGLLAIFLGGLGIHKFYLGQNLRGFLYLIFCWTRIPSIIGVFEGLSYFTHTDERRNEKYNDGKDASGEDVYDKLLKLDTLKEKGILTEEEYEEKAKQLKAKMKIKVTPKEDVKEEPKQYKATKKAKK